MNRDLYSNIAVRRAISPGSVSDNTAQVSQVIDTQGFRSVTFLIATGAIADADATFDVILEDGDAANLSDAAAVMDIDLIGLETDASFRYDDDNKCRKIGYIGARRYVRLTITPSGNGAAAWMAAWAVLGHPDVAPVTS